MRQCMKTSSILNILVHTRDVKTSSELSTITSCSFQFSTFMENYTLFDLKLDWTTFFNTSRPQETHKGLLKYSYLILYKLNQF